MSEARKPAGRSGQEPQSKCLSPEATENIKQSIIYGIGYKRPPEHTRFRKGQSRNPIGRPKKERQTYGSRRSANALALNEAERQIPVREGNEVRSMTTMEAIFRAQSATALKGNAYAQRHAIDRYERAERERRQQIAEEVKIWQRYVELRRQEMADAQANGTPVPTPLPHPDDVAIDPETGVRFIGPFDEESRRKLDETLKLRDVLLLQYALDKRLWEGPETGDPLDAPGTSYLFAEIMNRGVPERFRLSDSIIRVQLLTFDCLPKRELLRRTYRTWRALGIRRQRGLTYPSLRLGKRVLDEINTAISDVLPAVDH